MVGKNEFGFEIFDFDKIPRNSDLHPKVHHFRSSSIPSIINELEEHWNSVLKHKVCIPAHEIFIGNEDEISQRIPTTYIGDNLLMILPLCRLYVLPLRQRMAKRK